MAVSISPAVARTAVKSLPYATSANVKLPLFSSLQFPKELRILNTRSKSIKYESRTRSLTLFERNFMLHEWTLYVMLAGILSYVARVVP